MAELIYSAISSLDGYIADKEGNFDWAEPDEDVHTFINQLQRPVGTYLFGRRMYETMAVWETLQTNDQPRVIAEFADLWRAADKLVYSSTLHRVTTLKTRIEPAFEPEAVRRMKMSSPRDIAIGGPTLAAHAFKAGLVDVCYLFVSPIFVGGGKSAFPGGVRLNLTLQDERRFANGMVFLHYRSAQSQAV